MDQRFRAAVLSVLWSFGLLVFAAIALRRDFTVGVVVALAMLVISLAIAAHRVCRAKG